MDNRDLECIVGTLDQTTAHIRSSRPVIDRQCQVIEALHEWERAGVSGSVAAVWLGSLEKASSNVAPASLVWTGPVAKGLHSRNTKQVFEELVRAARESILISSYAYFDGPEAFKVLAEQMDSRSSLRVTVL